MIAIVDYGVGNITSLVNSLKHLSQRIVFTTDAQLIESASVVILPGVGKFDGAMRSIDENGLREVLDHRFRTNRPIIGICLGMQIMFESSDEAPGVSGLCWFKGRSRRLPDTMIVPHTGWNSVPMKDTLSATDYYFVHSYYVQLADRNLISYNCTYSLPFPAYIEKDAVIGFQFHPEISGKDGIKLLETSIVKTKGVKNEKICSDRPV
ncbi:MULTISPECIES: imidazole glycerol phosphate synthase subunit HisH [unclassified Fusibacter]|uniref:imidazole glycerol phosphate synthase subunit HisH n=1 Tax=unclassified Fusibacter TaxID=2624464 RepID=UPI0013E90D6A|nr:MULTISPECIES: imidazole glycerol phosphate synthase subunit HisH [unclassified Fusibacter]MCK8058848.1 imidazole glycerol phosphate synthase subunit HisH [Fusibacter sp. A2]NPE21922.1 imidazole glycerol phosphate synthase subunit HisH [Fusibacter sp. A1]